MRKQVSSSTDRQIDRQRLDIPDLNCKYRPLHITQKDRNKSVPAQNAHTGPGCHILIIITTNATIADGVSNDVLELDGRFRRSMT
jgi:hypothetical protein